ncbi:hypothetical protein VTN96DRAFT_1367 [Rasamsonia emersonii]
MQIRFLYRAPDYDIRRSNNFNWVSFKGRYALSIAFSLGGSSRHACLFRRHRSSRVSDRRTLYSSTPHTGRLRRVNRLSDHATITSRTKDGR